MMDVGRHPNIILYTNSQLTELTGSAGAFTAEISVKTRYVDPDLCTACGDCSAVCPVARPSDFDVGLSTRKAIYQPFPQAVPSAYIMDDQDCLGHVPIACGKCADACKVGCIDFDRPDEIIEVEVTAVIVATGIDYYNPREASEYGYTRFLNVVTSFELERLLSASGPTKGELLRFTNRETPETIAFINCVGSRNEKLDIHYCSRICCMNSIKSALVIREHYPDAEILVFYVDIRAFGKGFEEYFQRALDKGVKFIKGKPSKIVEDPQTNDPILFVENTQDGSVSKFPVDLAILNAAIIPSGGTKELAEVVGIELDEDSFFKELDPCANPLESTRPGIFLCGCSTAPKDITDSIAEASGAAAKAALVPEPEELEKEEGEEEIEKEEVEMEPETIAAGESLAETEGAPAGEIPQLDVSGEPRIGVFICHCGLNIAGVVCIEEVVEYARLLADVAYVEDSLFTCASSTQEHLQEMILEHDLNRVVVAACTPRTHEPIFQETLRAVGLNPYLFEMANIRDQCSWVHQNSPEAATAKARDLVRMSVARVRRLQPLEPREMTLKIAVLVVGGGVAGMQAASDISSRGFKTILIERESQLGGRVSQVATLYPSGMAGKQLVSQKLKELHEANVEILTNTCIEGISGFVGNFTVCLASQSNGRSLKRDIDVGAIVLAIGSDLYKPDGEFGYGQYANAFTNMEVERLLVEKGKFTVAGKKPRSIVYFQCVGSRNPETNPGCSRYCCQTAIKQAIKFRQQGINVTIFYRDIRMYSVGAERMYRKARELGILFVPYSVSDPPKVIGKQRVECVEFHQPILDTVLRLTVDAVVLSVGMVPKVGEHDNLANLLKVTRSGDQFFMERHPKLGPVETTTEGVFLTGCAQAPKDIGDSIVQSSAVAAKVAALLSKGTINLEPITSFVTKEFCRACETCVAICEYNAIAIEEEAGLRFAVVNEALCKGCGTCAAHCPSGAIDTHHFLKEQIDAVLDALLTS
ncbi:MAG: 4Fe-4S binding protein [Candidatus Neomarinimicrobiota bacterium]